VEVSPNFRAIFTSNPEEYAGVHKTQDALMDRLITIHLSHFDRKSEIQVTMAKSGISMADAETIVDIARELRGIGVNNNRPTIRACIAIARILARFGGRARMNDAIFLRICRDVMDTDTAKVTRGGKSLMSDKVEEVIQRVCGKQ
jgi:gas vesicle protein GvpN